MFHLLPAMQTFAFEQEVKHMLWSLARKITVSVQALWDLGAEKTKSD